MILQTGGLALGEISTKSSPASSDRSRALSGQTTPTLSPSLPISLISGHIMFSFTLGPVSREGGALCGLRTIDFFLI